jgi:hypothetical protein
MPTAKPADKLSLPKGTPSNVDKLGTFLGDPPVLLLVSNKN